MKKYITLLIIGVLFTACGGGGGDDPTPTPENKPPTTPVQVYPQNNDLCIDEAVNFQWNAATDPDNNPITYSVEITQTSNNSVITRSTSATSVTVDLAKGVAFSWKIKATDSKGLSSAYSSSNQFYTEGEGVTNHLPFSPTLVAPALNATVQTATTNLEWTASDVDGDTLTYDVYFGEGTLPATAIATGITENSYNVSLDSAKSYYWKIVANDGKGGQTIGQTWNFNTD